MQLMVKNIISHKEKIYNINDFNDLKEIFQDYPYTYSIALKYDTLDAILIGLAKYFNSKSRIHSYLIDNSKLNKTESQQDFSIKLKEWLKKRKRMEREILQNLKPIKVESLNNRPKTTLDKPVTNIDKLKNEIKNVNEH